MKRTLIALTTVVAVATSAITPATATTTPAATSSPVATSSPAESETEQPTSAPKKKQYSEGWSLTGSTPIDLALIIAGAVGLSFVVQQFMQGGFNQVINNLKKQFNLPM